MKIGPVLMIAGGAGLAAGTFTPWVTVKDVISKSGWVAGADGKVTLACGIIALVLGLVAVFAGIWLATSEPVAAKSEPSAGSAASR